MRIWIHEINGQTGTDLALAARSEQEFSQLPNRIESHDRLSTAQPHDVPTLDRAER